MKTLRLMMYVALFGTLLAVPGEACDGCRVQKSPAFGYVFDVTFFHAPVYLILLLALPASFLLRSNAEQRVEFRRTVRASATLLAGLSFGGFLAVFSFEALCWQLLDRSLVPGWEGTLYQVNAWMRVLVLTPLLVLSSHPMAWLQRNPAVVSRLAHPGWILSPVAGLPVIWIMPVLAVSTPAVWALPAGLGLGAVWLLCMMKVLRTPRKELARA